MKCICRSTENLLHRLFVCIAGVADQLQTNFASDLRQILRSVFLMNVSPPPIEDIEIDISNKSKDSTSDLFEFRASENDVIHENDGGSNQSIYSAEEANPETDSVFEQSIVQSLPPGSDHQERSASLETEIRITHSRVNVERSQSLGDDPSTRPVSLVVNTTHQIQCVERNGNHTESTDNSPQTNVPRILANVNNNNGNVNNNQSSRPVDNSSTMATTTTTIILTTNSRLNRNDQQTQPQQQITETPPRWIPDEEAAQCKCFNYISISKSSQLLTNDFSLQACRVHKRSQRFDDDTIVDAVVVYFVESVQILRHRYRNSGSTKPYACVAIVFQ